MKVQPAPRRAKILNGSELQLVLRYARFTRHADRNRVMVLLSFKAGLRACEIAGLTWEMVLDASGRIGDTLDLAAGITKRSKPRLIPIHPMLRTALVKLRRRSTGRGPIIVSERAQAMSSISICNWFYVAYTACALKGCSSHTGRRTFITRAARLLHRAGASIVDVQILAGHSQLESTQRYIDGDTRLQRRLLNLV